MLKLLDCDALKAALAMTGKSALSHCEPWAKQSIDFMMSHSSLKQITLSAYNAHIVDLY